MIKAVRSAWLWVGLGAAGLTAVGLAVLGARVTDPVGRPSASSTPPLWLEGQSYRFELALEHEATSRLPVPAAGGDAGAITVRTELGADLSWDVRSVSSTAAWVELGWERIDRAGVTVDGEPTFDGARLEAALRASSVALTLPLDGSPPSFDVNDAGEAELEVARIVVAVLGHLAWRAPDVLPMEYEGERLEGRVGYRLTRLGDREGTTYARAIVQLLRPAAVPLTGAGTSDFASTVQGEARIDVDRRGLRAWTESVETSVRDASGQPWSRSSSRFTLTRLDVARSRPSLAARPAKVRRYRTDRPLVSREAQRQLLEGQAAGRTFEQVLSDLRRFSFTESRPDDKRRVWETVGLLDLHPELIGELEAAYSTEDLSAPARDRVLDLLAAVESVEGQRAILRILGRLYDEGSWGEMAEGAKRLMLVAAPEPATGATLARWLDAPQLPVRVSAAVALGAVVHRLAAQDPALARSLNARLLESSRDPSLPEAARAPLIDALGNAGQPENVARLAEISADTREPLLRAHVAFALRHTETIEARTLAVELSEDAHPVVQGRAFDVLSRYRKVEPEVLDGVVDRLRDDAIEPRSFAYVLSLLRAHPGERTREGMTILRAHAEADPQLRGRIARLLKEDPP